MVLVKLLQRSLTCHTYFRQVLPLSFVQISYQQTARYPQQRNSYHHHRHHHHQQQNNDSNSARHHLPHWLFIATGTIATLGLSTYLKVTRSPENAAKLPESGSLQKGLPTYSKEEIANHDSVGKKIWVIYKNGVYDVTDYINKHPGGKKILLAAGKSIEPFWAMYAVHKNPEILKILEHYRIGNYIPKPEDLPKAKDASDPYANDPKRHPILIPSSETPFNAEPPLEILTDNFITPKEVFFVRNHLPVPHVDIKKYQLEVTAKNSKKVIKLSFDDLKKFPKHQVISVVQCAGNRRSEMKAVKSVKGLNWGNAAIGNAVWTGVRLIDVFEHAGVDINNPEYKHVQFEGLDIDPTGMPYGASIPIELFNIIKNDVILAYEMNGEQITADHGYPLRVIIPGVVGARQVKWLKKVLLSNEESLSHWQRRDYKGFNPSIDWHNVDFDKAESIQQYPVQSVICVPSDGSFIDEDETEIELEGYAWSGGGRGIIRVDVSVDGGKTWQDATIHPTEQSLYHAYAWTLWSATVPLPANHNGKLDVVCKATDVSYNTQPDSVEGIWNLRGVLSNAWHHITVKVNPVSE